MKKLLLPHSVFFYFYFFLLFLFLKTNTEGRDGELFKKLKGNTYKPIYLNNYDIAKMCLKTPKGLRI